MQDPSFRARRAKPHWPRALDPKLSCSLQDSAVGASDRAAVVGCGCVPRLQGVAVDIASSSPDAPAAISSGWPAHPRRRWNPSGFAPGDSRCAGGAVNPARYRPFVVVDNGKVEKSAGSIGNTGLNSRGSCSPQVQNFEPPSKTKSPAETNIETFVEFLPRPCRWGFHGWFSGSGLYRRIWLRLSPALTVAEQGRKWTSLRSSFHTGTDQAVLHHSGVQERPDEL